MNKLKEQRGVIECPNCGYQMYDGEKTRKEMKTHRDECPGAETAKDKFDEEDQVTWSEFGKERLGKTYDLGIVDSVNTAEENTVRVRWEGNKTSTKYSMHFIKKVEWDTNEKSN